MRQFVARTKIAPDGTLLVSGDDFRYLKQVLRIKNGDMLSVRLTDGSLCDMTASQVDSARREITLQICAKNRAKSAHFVSENGAKSADSGFPLWLFQFIAKPQKMDLIVRQAAECGAEIIVPVIGEYCDKGALSALKSAGRAERWERIVREAMGQSGSAVKTKVLAPMSVVEAADFWKREGGGLSLCIYERDENTVPLHKALSSVSGTERAGIAVGAEGGISPDEVRILAQEGFCTVHFATNILRCETAALYAIAAVQSALSERKLWQFKE